LVAIFDGHFLLGGREAGAFEHRKWQKIELVDGMKRTDSAIFSSVLGLLETLETARKIQ